MGKTILIVEDSPMCMKLLNDLVSSVGHETINTSTGEEALELAFQHRPELIILDYKLPGMSGVEVNKVLKNDPRTNEIPVIVVSSHCNEREGQQLVLSGFEAFVPKPVSTNKLIDLISKII
ncbi:Polar-differentiation response regulator DivK [Candidatus Terasakiella magnetica]|uniref:Polar-differentiation response regulator DivK n=1 Tax=Candidatus Terasakiella magnetica TaxID=1867952 RepID=A0A1C3RDV2_9PROT|nr:response regulator [Candidatus Terasakiella magnetica]SCA55418.1 Polar-differentiation response regulator DivK [Candidatus Terasakiella magnetica]